jgi:hypothetical protein
MKELEETVDLVMRANEPTVLEEGGFEKLTEIAHRRYLDPSGVEKPYLTENEVTALRIPRGSLTQEERREIETHVVHTYNFLQQIPWGRRLSNIPDIAGSHHELLDGSGYPKKSKEIRVETRMMTIADIFDALTAADRPYKKAVPVKKALEIIESEVNRGRCDRDLFKIFVETKIWTSVLPE